MNTSDFKHRLGKSVDVLKNDLSQIRTGRATPTLIENIRLEAYGAPMTVKELGSTTVLDSQNLIFSAWDENLTRQIANAIRDSDLKVNPVVDGDSIRIPVPELTEERRHDFAKVVSVKVEECKNALRNLRQECMKDIERDFAEKRIGEDDKYSQRDEVEKIVKEFVEMAEAAGDQKKSELMKL